MLVPSKIAFFAWRVYWGRIQIINNLNKRGTMVGNECKLCWEEEESVDHMLLNCSFAKKVWEHSLPTIENPWIFPDSTKACLGKDLIQGVLSTKVNWIQRRLIKAIMWVIWKERNARI